MENKTKLNEEELNKATGGVIVPSDTWFKCRDCGASWFTNRPDVCYKCPKCNSSNTERI